MNGKIKIFDTTLRDGEQTPGVSLNIKEKLVIAKQLEVLGVDIIEAGFAIASEGDFKAVQAIAETIKDATIASLARAVKKDIDVAYEAVKNASSPRIHTFIATSDIHMKYKLKMSEEEVLERIKQMVEYSKKYISDIQFSAEDASRSNVQFLYKAYETAIKAGATVLNIPDTVGYALPEEFGLFVKGVMENVKGIEKVDVAVHCHNDLGLGVANTLAGMVNGANQLECTINGLGERAGNAALEEIIMTINTRQDVYKQIHNINSKQIIKTSNLVSKLTGVHVQPNKAIVGKNAFAHESGIHQHGVLAKKSTYEIMTPESVGLAQNDMVLGKHSGRHAFSERLKEMGYTLTEEELNETFKKFKRIADKKKQVLTQDIEALVTDKIYTVEEVFALDSFQINTGNKLISTATVRLLKDDVEITKAATGDGPVDAAFNAIEDCVGLSMTLEEYKIAAVTSGKDALGEVNIRVKNNGSYFIGHGVSTDIIEASIKAYLNVANRVYQTLQSKD